MKSLTWKSAGAFASGVFGGCSLVVAVVACSSSSAPPPPPTQTAAGECSAAAGQFPAPNCLTYAPANALCATTPVACDTAPCTSSSPCLAMGQDNSGKSVADLRIRRLDVSAPKALATAFVQKTVLNQGIDLHGQCGEGGDGTFSWLIQLDTANNKVTTGGAPPTTDPFGTGYCFVNTTIGALQVGPVTVNMTKGSDGTWSSDVIPKLNVPIYPPGNSPIVLPISGGRVKSVTLSSDNNCIGSYNPNAITTSDGGAMGACTDDVSSCDRWLTAGSIGGYITLEEADKVLVPQLSESLCVLLTGAMDITTGPTGEKLCARDANGQIKDKGDYCSSPVGPGACGDSFWLAAAFAASAAKIGDSSLDPQCKGGPAPMGDGGTGTTDAAGD